MQASLSPRLHQSWSSWPRALSLAWPGTRVVKTALAAGLATPLYMLWLTGSAWLTGATLVMAVLIFWRHRGNIRNLIQGSEDTISSKL